MTSNLLEILQIAIRFLNWIYCFHQYFSQQCVLPMHINQINYKSQSTVQNFIE
jgi:hypothetical protein